ncbi:MAG: MscS Mechanosensitive ion channel [Verrucomicrobiales bacterium]|nr:MscS Mechanosensitive ion channel [Verrucomicrobiales bacterium]
MQEAKTFIVTFFLSYGLQILAALIILGIGFYAAGWVGKLMMKSLEKKGMEPPLRLLLVRVVRLLIVGFTVIIALEKFGVPITSLVAGIGVAGVGIGLAMQGVLGNLVAGLLIIFTKPFRVGEYIELLGVNGQVTVIELFSTTLAHPDRSRVVIPNRRIIGEVLHNYGQMRQVQINVSVPFDTDIPRALSILEAAGRSNPRVLKDLKPGLGIATLSNSSIVLTLAPWVSLADYGPTQGELYQAIVERFRDERIRIAVPTQEVRVLERVA